MKLSVEYMSFSAHADAKGIMQLIRTCEPKNVVLVHGENLKMDFLKDQIIKEFGIIELNDYRIISIYITNRIFN